ncbi:MAG: hypothetical protein Q8P18_03520 [Pseudomonadota bacterium]|nr:hypothetical protein [Pseudomonadota bacterium]
MLLLLAACARPIPPALEIEASGSSEAPPEPTDPAALLAWIIGDDPLARRTRTPSAAGDTALAAWSAVAQSAAPSPTEWASIEAAHRGTPVVALARGARLAALETALADPPAALGWAVPLPSGDPSQDQVRPALDWLGAKPEALLGVVERQVLLGWLDAPGIPVGAAARALSAPTYDRASATPAGALLLARAALPRDPDAAAAGRVALEEATWLALMGTAADRDAEQVTLKALRADAGARAGVSGDPTNTLLTRAWQGLAADAGANDSTGLALVAQAALRWRNACTDAPCGGFDRVAVMEDAKRWDPTVAPLADAWRVIAAKDALDHLQAAYDDPSFPHALDAIVEVLLGTGGTVDRSLLLYPSPGAPVQLALSRAAGGGDLTTREDLFRTLEGRLAKQARAAAATAPERFREPLTRIAKRAE